MKISHWPCCIIDPEIIHAKMYLKATSQMVQLFLSTICPVIFQKPLKEIHCAVVNEADFYFYFLSFDFIKKMLLLCS